MRWSVNGVVTGSKHLGIFEADTMEAAIDKALKAEGGRISLCHQCSKECEDGSIDEAVADPFE